MNPDTQNSPTNQLTAFVHLPYTRNPKPELAKPSEPRVRESLNTRVLLCTRKEFPIFGTQKAQTTSFELQYFKGIAERAEQLLSMVETMASHSNLQLNWDKSVLLKSPSSCHRASSNARKHFNTLHHFRKHTGLPLHWKLRISNAVLVPMVVYGMASAALTPPDLHRTEAFHSLSLRKMHRISARFETNVLAPDQPTTSNQQLREQSSHPTIRTSHPQSTAKVVWSCFESIGELFSKELLFHEIFSLQGRRRGFRAQERATQNTRGSTVCHIGMALAT